MTMLGNALMRYGVLICCVLVPENRKGGKPLWLCETWYPRGKRGSVLVQSESDMRRIASPI
jgi:hypothetical protein